MQPGYCHSLILATIVLLAACSHAPPRGVQTEHSSLQDWVENELSGYVTQQFSQHPRFKGQPVIIVRLEGDDIRPDIDGLTRGLRDRLMDSLLTSPGVLVPWQPQHPRAEHHRRLDQLQCGRQRDASYFIGIETTRTVNDRFRVSMRVLDVRAGEWVSGFTRQWTGDLTSSEMRALQTRRTDESLRGLRVLPFNSGQSDLAATYLANNLSCLLRKQDVEDLQIHVDVSKTDDARLQTLLGLIGNNLSRYREVQVTDERRQANYILRGELHSIQPNLFQVWVILHPVDSGMHLSGVDTATYLRVTPPVNEPGERRMARDPVQYTPAIARMELVRHTNGGGYHTACEQGSRGCPVLELDVDSADEVLVIVHGIEDGISRLSGRCDLGNRPSGASDSYTFRYPEARFSESDWPTLYAVAVRGSDTSRQLQRLRQELPDACSGSAGLAADTDTRNRWLDQLDRLIASHPTQAVWAARRIP
jgi:hypothetical protein